MATVKTVVRSMQGLRQEAVERLFLSEQRSKQAASKRVVRSVRVGNKQATGR